MPTFSQTLVYDNLGDAVRALRNGRVNVYEFGTTTVAAGLTQGGVPVSFLTSDANGGVTWSATSGIVDLVSPNGLKQTVVAQSALIAAANMPLAADSNIASFIGSSGSATQTALDGRYRRASGNLLDVRAFGLASLGLKAAINAARAQIQSSGAGGVIYIPGGTYLYDGWTETEAAALAAANDTHFVGDGSATVLRLNSTATGNPMLLPLLGANVSATGLAFDTNGVSNATCVRVYGGSARARVSNCVFNTPKTGGVYIMPGTVTDLIITDNHFNGAKWGILTQDGCTLDGLTITGNTLRGGTGGDGIEINTPTGAARNITITGNVVSGYGSTGSGGGDGIGIAVAHASGVTITGNTVQSCGLDGIHVEDASHAVTVTGNIVRDCVSNGVVVYTSLGASGDTNLTGQVTVTGNIVTGCGTGNGQGGISFTGGTLSPASKDHIIANNIVHNCGRTLSSGDFAGIRVGYGDGRTLVTGNIVTNTIGDPVNASGICVDAATDVFVSGNRCTDDQATKTQMFGLRLSTSTSVVKMGFNDFTGNGTSDTSAGSGTLINLLPTAIPTGTHDLAVGTSNIPRWAASSTAVTMISGTMRIMSLVPTQSYMTVKVRVQTGATAAGATPSVVQFGLYTVSSSGNMTLIASTTNDTTLLAAANTVYEVPWTTGVALTAGTRYAIGILLITAAATPTMQGVIAGSDVASLPRVSSALGGVSGSVPSSILLASTSGSGQIPYAAAI